MRHAHGLLHAQHLFCHVYISAAVVYPWQYMCMEIDKSVHDIEQTAGT
jgi:hypothetical protein